MLSLQSLTSTCICLTVLCRVTGVVVTVPYIHLHLPYSVVHGDRCCRYSPLHPPASALQCCAGVTGVVVTVPYIHLHLLYSAVQGNRCCCSPLHPPVSALQCCEGVIGVVVSVTYICFTVLCRVTDVVVTVPYIHLHVSYSAVQG